MHNNSRNNQSKTAAFTDKNNNPAINGELNVSYQWNFTCDAPFTVCRSTRSSRTAETAGQSSELSPDRV